MTQIWFQLIVNFVQILINHMLLYTNKAFVCTITGQTIDAIFRCYLLWRPFFLSVAYIMITAVQSEPESAFVAQNRPIIKQNNLAFIGLCWSLRASVRSEWSPDWLGQPCVSRLPWFEPSIVSTDVSNSMNIYTIVESSGGLREALHSCLIAEEVFHHIIMLDG